ncbi:VWA domain-containing protein [Palleronia caenipelagi]|uniref:VWA domain-containing protein n=1 Tax=Palleronia caenipelagi TaxID=2489174 RepID=A0A547Q931_9RHOB|nr:VWA domain-containing protein [Palleronia caenipelagi]TRD22878.1 VWA domain-containing protein [Palleronia caenipelagi]
MNPVWQRACRAAAVLALDPVGLGGLWLRARPSPARDAFLARLAPLDPARIHPDISDAALFGGPDLVATLQAGRVVHRAGVAERARLLQLTMAERATPGLAARLAGLIDRQDLEVLAVDEGADAEEQPPRALTSRLGLFVALDGLALADLQATSPDLEDARGRLDQMALPDDIDRTLAEIALMLGVTSPAAALRTRAALRCLAALDGEAGPAQIEEAASLTLAHLAGPPMDVPEAPHEPETSEAQDEEPAQRGEAMVERVVEATRVVLPPDLMTALQLGRTRRHAGKGEGAKLRQMGGRGRPLPARPGHPDGGRIDVIATLRAAAPWQTIRHRSMGARDQRRVIVLPEDIRLARSEISAERLVIFAVDASGSAAIARMAEAKGAVEALLSGAYAARDSVALIGFRGTEAELIVPPTRSLTRARRCLCGLPGGGATPLATGLEAARALAGQSERRGATPVIVLLTDGRANMALDGTADRGRAAEDATRSATALAGDARQVIVVDTAIRPNRRLKELANQAGGRYLPLPRADVGALPEALRA